MIEKPLSVLRTLVLMAALSLCAVPHAQSDVIFDFIKTTEGGDFLCPRFQCGEDIVIAPLSASISFTDAALAAGEATLADVTSFSFVGGDVVFTLPQLEGPPQKIFFSADGSSITAFESQRFIIGLGFVPVALWQFRTGDVTGVSLGAEMTATSLRDGLLFRDTLLGGAFAEGVWQVRAVPEPGITALCVTGLVGLLLRRRKSPIGPTA